MPANLTPEYERAERRYREALDDAERMAALQEMLAVIPKHKGTEKLQAELKRRLSQLRRAEQKAGPGKGPDPFHLPKHGAGQVVLAGPPNTGKSSLLAATTHAPVRVADFPFTTVVPQPGMWLREDVQLELVDTPPLTADHVPAGLMGTLRNADVVGLVVEAGDAGLEQAETVLELFRERGLMLRSVPRSALAALPTGTRPGLLVVNKTDLTGGQALDVLRDLYAGQLDVLGVSARTGEGLDALFRRLWELLAVVRVYSKEPGKAPDMNRPFTLPEGATVADLARHIHRDLPDTMRFARLWGHSRFPGQAVPKTEVLRDRDIVEIHG